MKNSKIYLILLCQHARMLQSFNMSINGKVQLLNLFNFPPTEPGKLKLIFILKINSFSQLTVAKPITYFVFQFSCQLWQPSSLELAVSNSGTPRPELGGELGWLMGDCFHQQILAGGLTSLFVSFRKEENVSYTVRNVSSMDQKLRNKFSFDKRN